MFSLAVKKCVLAFSNWLPLQQFVSVHISKAQYIKSDCHKLGVVPVLKGLHGNWDTVHLGEKVVSQRGDILIARV